MPLGPDPNIDYSHDVYPDDKWFEPVNGPSAAALTNVTNDSQHEVEIPAADLEELPEIPVARISTTLAAFGRLVKRTKKFSATTEAEFDTFCEVSHIILYIF